MFAVTLFIGWPEKHAGFDRFKIIVSAGKRTSVCSVEI